MLQDIYRKVHNRNRISDEDALELFKGAELLRLGQLAQYRSTQFHPINRATFLIDRNINYTNICTSRCRFCAFYKDETSPEAYLLSSAEILMKIGEAVSKGATQVMLQGGLHPSLPLDYFEEVLQNIKTNFDIYIHSFSPPEIYHLAKISNHSVENVLLRLRSAGLDSLPGGGAEILSDRVRQEVSPHKISASDWLKVMEIAHQVGLRTTATMMMGGIETLGERVEHLRKIRSLQDKTGGFRAFIP
jgi:cyclic dehypoxanthinyl futalosine synthase